MTKGRYNQIRRDREFLFIYFNEESKAQVPHAHFHNLLGAWLVMNVGVEPSIGIAKIVNFLDKKFGYNGVNA
jgi:hypothetical protein